MKIEILEFLWAHLSFSNHFCFVHFENLPGRGMEVVAVAGVWWSGRNSVRGGMSVRGSLRVVGCWGDWTTQIGFQGDRRMSNTWRASGWSSGKWDPAGARVPHRRFQQLRVRDDCLARGACVIRADLPASIWTVGS